MLEFFSGKSQEGIDGDRVQRYRCDRLYMVEWEFLRLDCNNCTCM